MQAGAEQKTKGRTHPLGVMRWFADSGEVVIDWVTAVGGVSFFTIQTISWLISRLPRKETLLPNFYQVGVRSLPVVALTGTFIGMVLAVQSYAQFAHIGLQTRLGGVINMSLVTELGPVLAGTMLAGRVGSAMAAELGTIKDYDFEAALNTLKEKEPNRWRHLRDGEGADRRYPVLSADTAVQFRSTALSEIQAFLRGTFPSLAETDKPELQDN